MATAIEANSIKSKASIKITCLNNFKQFAIERIPKTKTNFFDRCNFFSIPRCMFKKKLNLHVCIYIDRSGR